MDFENSEEFKILLIEDRENDIEITCEALSATKIESDLHVIRDGVIRDGKEALDYLLRIEDSQESWPDLVLLDLSLPKVGGEEILEKMNEHEILRQIPTVVLTVSSLDKDIACSYDSGAAGYITKPMDFEEFVKTIDIVKKYWSICERPELG